MLFLLAYLDQSKYHKVHNKDFHLYTLLNQVEQLSICESKLINEIKNLNYLENSENHHIVNQKKIVRSNRVSSNKISSFMINWSNKFVVIALLTISAIALSKQAWA